MHKRAISFLLSAAIILSLFCGMAPVARAASMTTSDDCVDLIKEFEGFSQYPYYDNGQYTVGYGTACPDDKLEEYQTNGISEEDAVALLREYLTSFESSLNSFISRKGLSLKQCQFDALLSFTYNCGIGWMSESTGTFYNAVVSGATGNDFIYAIGRWCTASGQVVSHLIQRRLIEANMYLNGVYSTSVPSNYKYVIYDDNLDSATNSVRVQAYDASVGDSIRSTPTASGYTFLGWYTKASGGTKVTSLTASLSVKTLYAHWESSDGSGDSGSGSTETVIATGVVSGTDRLNVRSGAGTGNSLVGYLYRGDEVEIYETTLVGSTTWGRIADGWISLDYVTLDSDEPDTVIATGVVTATSLNIRSGPGTSYSSVGTLSQGTAVEIYETADNGGTTWGRIADGWISMDYVKLDSEEEDTVIATGVVNTERLNVRSGAGTGNALVGYLYEGDVVEIYETTLVGSTTWGRVSSGWISLDYVTFTLEAPVLTVSNVASSGKPRVSWNAVDGADQYILYIYRDGELLKTATTSGTALTHSSAEAGTTYSYKVKAQSTVTSVTSAASAAKSRCCDLARPVVSVGNVASTGKVRVSWDAVDGAAKYTLYVYSGGELLKSTTVTGTAVTHNSSVAGVSYSYKVKAQCSVSAAASAVSEAKTRTCDLAQPSFSIGNVASSGKVRLSWNAVDGAVGYEVYRATSKNGTYTLLNTVTGTGFTNTSGVAGTTYYYKIRAIAAVSAANSAYSSVKYRTCDLAQPSFSIGNVASSGKVRLTWDAVDGAVSYQIYRATSKDGTYTLLKTTTSTSFTNTSGVAGTTYYYKIRAIAAASAANSAYSSVKYRTCDLARPVVAVTLSSGGKPSLSWDAVDGAVEYQIYRSDSKNGTYTLLKTITGTSFVNTSADADTTYYYKVIAIASKSAANSARSAVVSITSD